MRKDLKFQTIRPFT